MDNSIAATSETVRQEWEKHVKHNGRRTRTIRNLNESTRSLLERHRRSETVTKFRPQETELKYDYEEEHSWSSCKFVRSFGFPLPVCYSFDNNLSDIVAREYFIGWSISIKYSRRMGRLVPRGSNYRTYLNSRIPLWSSRQQAGKYTTSRFFRRKSFGLRSGYVLRMEDVHTNVLTQFLFPKSRFAPMK